MDIGFIIKKAISILIEPLSIFFLIFFIALYNLHKNKQKSFYIFSISIIYLFLITNPKISDLLLEPLENSFHQIKKIDTNIKYIVLIGGDGKNRGWEALRLLKNIPNSKIIVSGYKGNKKLPEAIRNANRFKSIGIDLKRIIILPKPKDTIEEAKEIKKTLKNKRFYLVTSAYHMPRASMIFKYYKLNFKEAPTNYLHSYKSSFFSFPYYTNLVKTSKAVHEYIGILFLKLKFFISETSHHLKH